MENVTRLLTVKEASDATRLCKSKIYDLIYKGVLRRVRLPNCSKVLIAEDELRRYITKGFEAGCVPANA